MNADVQAARRRANARFGTGRGSPPAPAERLRSLPCPGPRPSRHPPRPVGRQQPAERRPPAGAAGRAVSGWATPGPAPPGSGRDRGAARAGTPAGPHPSAAPGHQVGLRGGVLVRLGPETSPRGSDRGSLEKDPPRRAPRQRPTGVECDESVYFRARLIVGGQPVRHYACSGMGLSRWMPPHGHQIRLSSTAHAKPSPKDRDFMGLC